MIERAYAHVAGPDGTGKTTFIEAMLRGIDARHGRVSTRGGAR